MPSFKEGSHILIQFSLLKRERFTDLIMRKIFLIDTFINLLIYDKSNLYSAPCLAENKTYHITNKQSHICIKVKIIQELLWPLDNVQCPDLRMGGNCSYFNFNSPTRSSKRDDLWVWISTFANSPSPLPALDIRDWSWDVGQVFLLQRDH